MSMAHDDDDLSHAALTKMAKQLDDAVGDVTDIEKAGGGAHDLAGALLRHLQDRLESKREAHGFAKRKDNMDSLDKIAKDNGVVAIAKAIADENRAYGITEEEFVQFATEDAVKKFPDKTPDAAFTRMFTDGGSDGLVLRRAHAVVRAEQLYGPTYAKADRSESAYNELMAKAEEYRNAHPELSISQAFEKIYTAPANVALAKRERVESAPR
jgi:hypothetical protein